MNYEYLLELITLSELITHHPIDYTYEYNRALFLHCLKLGENPNQLLNGISMFNLLIDNDRRVLKLSENNYRRKQPINPNLTDIITLMMEYGLDINMPDTNGDIWLHYAIKCDYSLKRLVSFFDSNTVNQAKNIQNKQGYYPWQILLEQEIKIINSAKEWDLCIGYDDSNVEEFLETLNPICCDVHQNFDFNSETLKGLHTALTFFVDRYNPYSSLNIANAENVFTIALSRNYFKIAELVKKHFKKELQVALNNADNALLRTSWQKYNAHVERPAFKFEFNNQRFYKSMTAPIGFLFENSYSSSCNNSTTLSKSDFTDIAIRTTLSKI